MYYDAAAYSYKHSDMLGIYFDMLTQKKNLNPKQTNKKNPNPKQTNKQNPNPKPKYLHNRDSYKVLQTDM